MASPPPSVTGDDEPQDIYGSSFLSVVTSDFEQYKKTVAFYKALGFQDVRLYRQNQPEFGVGMDSATSHSRQSIAETWLNALPSAEEYNHTDTSMPFGATVKVRLTESAPSLKDIEKLFDQFQDYFEKRDWRGIIASFVFYTPNLHEYIERLKKISPLKESIQCYPSAAAPVEVYTMDPTGIVIGFTDRANPFTSAPVGNPKLVKEEGIISARPSRAPSPSSLGKNRRRKIAVLTSGGDAPGMNAVVRAVVRTAITHGCDAFAIYEGYEGLLRGGNYIKQMSKDDVRGLLSLGGTVIGTARCKGFRTEEGRLQAAYNLIDNGINGLIVCGGDGSLTGADVFRKDWPDLVKKLHSQKKITDSQLDEFQHLYICGIVGSIDNDMSGTDATIGAFSSLARICEMVDYIDATAQSHSRAFVIEVMGRHCGFLALMAGIATGADYVFIPEKPPRSLEWHAKMREVVMRHRSKGMRKTIVIVAEGAIDDCLSPISAEMVKDQLVDMGLDTRITTLGHVQRGGTAVAFDRLLGTLQGVRSVEALLDLKPGSPSPLIGVRENKIEVVDLMEAVKLTTSVADAIENKDFEKALSLRDTEFHNHLNNMYVLTDADSEEPRFPAEKPLNIAIVTVGAPAGGMNAAVRAAAAYCFSRGHKPFAIQNGWTGLVRHESVKPIDWLQVSHWITEGGCEIGTNRSLPSIDLGMISYYFQKYNFDGLIIIGGFEAFASLHELEQARGSYPALRIPMVCLPATISNNVPGTEYSLGTDTCLNELVNYCDVIKQSAAATRRRAFVVEVQGGNSGYVAAYCGLVTGAHVIYTPEEGITLKQLESDIQFLKRCFEADQGRNRSGRLIIRNEKASKTFDTRTLVKIIQEESGGKFDARASIPGHFQQGLVPSPMDRVRATRLAFNCVQFLEDNQKTRSASVLDMVSMYSVVGIRAAKLVFTDVATLWDYETEVDFRRPNKVFWGHMIEVSAMLEGRPHEPPKNVDAS